MKLTNDLFKRMNTAGRRFVGVKQQFSSFTNQLEYFLQPSCPVSGVTIAPSQDGCFVLAAFTTVTVGFRLLHTLEAERPTMGKVICTLEQPTFTEDKPVIGSFTFGPNGLTDIEAPDEADPIDLTFCACDIVLHFINMALERPTP